MRARCGLKRIGPIPFFFRGQQLSYENCIASETHLFTKTLCVSSSTKCVKITQKVKIFAFSLLCPKMTKIATFSFRRNNETKLFFPLKDIPMRLFWVVFKHCTSVFLIHISDMTLNFSKLSKIQQQRNEQ